MQQNLIENNLLILSKQTYDLFLKADNPMDLVSLYTFYYYTAKWQETNQPKCTTKYAAVGLRCGEEKIRRVKKQLIELGLIDNIVAKDKETGKVIGHYIRLNYIWKTGTISKVFDESPPPHKPGSGLDPGRASHGGNALSANNINALNANKERDITHLPQKSSKKQESIELIFDFWNQYKNDKKWKSHKKISYDIKQAILLNLKHYTSEEICYAIYNYAKVLLDDKYFWTYPWTLSKFLTIGTGKNAKSDQPKWWQFLEDNFIEANYMFRTSSSVPKVIDEKTSDLTEDPNVELTNSIIKIYGSLINNKEYEPLNNSEKNKFIETSKKMIEYYTKHSIIRRNWIKYLMKCLIKNYKEKGDIIHPGHLCSRKTWEVLMPQFLAELGIGR